MITMPSKSKQKGNSFDKECVDKAIEKGLDSKRAWGSDGRSLGEHPEVDLLINKHKADISVIVNTQSKTVSFRRSKSCDADVSILAQKLCNGGGHAAAAGGKLTEQFATLTKQFTPC